jgi:hypothetical protein
MSDIQPPETPDPPENVKTALWLWHHTKEHREALLKPPVLVVYIVLVCGAYWFGTNRSGEEIAVKNERLTFANEQLAAYKDRLQGASPDQAAKEIALLRDRAEKADEKLKTIFPDKPRRLLPAHKDVLISRKDELTKLIPPPLSVFAWYVGDSVGFASDFVALFTDDLKIQAFGPMATICHASQRGILIGVANPDKPPDVALKFKAILQSATLNSLFTRWEGQPLESMDFDLFICPE